MPAPSPTRDSPVTLARERCLQGLFRALAALLVIVLATGLLLWQTRAQIEQHSQRQLGLLAQQLASALQPMLLNHDRLGMQRSLEALIDTRTLTGIRLLAADGQTLAAAGLRGARPAAIAHGIGFEGQTLARLELYTQPALNNLPWWPVLLLVAAVLAMALLCGQWLRLLRAQPEPVVAATLPEPGLQWPAGLDTAPAQTALCLGIRNYHSLAQSLSPALLDQHVHDTLALLVSALGNERVPVLPLGPGRFLLVFADARIAAGVSRTLTVQRMAGNQARRTEGALPLRLQIGLCRESAAEARATAATRCLALQQQALSLLDLDGLCDDGDILVAEDCGAQLQALYPDLALIPIGDEDGRSRAWRWQSCAQPD